MTTTARTTRAWRWRRAGAVLSGLAVVVLSVLPAAADPPADTLAVTASSPVLAGNLITGIDNTGIPVGPLVITDTLAATTPTAWAVSVAASNCGPSAATLGLAQFSGLSAANVTVPSNRLTFFPGAIALDTGLGLAETTPVTGTASTFSTPGGGGFSTPITVATGPTGATTLDNNGQWTQGATLSIDLSNLITVPGAYSCVLQYTITG